MSVGTTKVGKLMSSNVSTGEEAVFIDVGERMCTAIRHCHGDILWAMSRFAAGELCGSFAICADGCSASVSGSIFVDVAGWSAAERLLWVPCDSISTDIFGTVLSLSDALVCVMDPSILWDVLLEVDVTAHSSWYSYVIDTYPSDVPYDSVVGVLSIANVAGASLWVDEAGVGCSDVSALVCDTVVCHWWEGCS